MILPPDSFDLLYQLQFEMLAQMDAALLEHADIHAGLRRGRALGLRPGESSGY